MATPRLVGPTKKIDAWFCPDCGRVRCAHVGYEDDRRDPDYGRAMCVLECGHTSFGNRRGGQTAASCVMCLPGRWLVHVREDDRVRLAAKRERLRKKERRARIVEAFAEAMRPPPPFSPRPPIPLRRPAPAAPAPGAALA